MSWRDERDRAAAAHAAAEVRRQAAEADEARRLVAGFAREARARGLRATPLRATAYGGGASYRTPLRGWYLKRDRTLAAGVDGEFYILSVPPSLLARVRGADVAPGVPRLVVGRGARDGESMPLADLLARRLAAGDDWP